MARFIDQIKRSHYCGELRATDIGKEVVLFGWVAHRRDFGGCIFIDLRDRDGMTQVVFDTAFEPKADVERLPSVKDEPFWDKKTVETSHATAEDVRREWVIGVRGVVVHRGDKNVNDKLPTGEVEIASPRSPSSTRPRRPRSPSRTTFRPTRRCACATATSI